MSVVQYVAVIERRNGDIPQADVEYFHRWNGGKDDITVLPIYNLVLFQIDITLIEGYWVTCYINEPKIPRASPRLPGIYLIRAIYSVAP
jgi:hypothetical protein